MRQRTADYEEAVLGVVVLIPPAKVLTYGDIAEILEQGGPRQVGAVMSRGPSGIPWWRVIRADGRPPYRLEGLAVGHYRQESTPMRRVPAPPSRTGEPAGYLLDLRLARWNPLPHEQDTLREIRRRLGRSLAGDCPELSEPDDGVDP